GKGVLREPAASSSRQLPDARRESNRARTGVGQPGIVLVQATKNVLGAHIGCLMGRPNAGLFVVVVRVLANLMAQFTEPCEGASDVCSAKRGPERMDKKRERQRGVVGTLGG